MEKYSRILSPTRGGASSYPNQDRVIRLAREHEAALFFLYVTDISFLNRLASPILVDVEQEIDEMGEFVLAMAQERAKRAGVEAQTLVRRGDFRAVLQGVIIENGIDLVIFGSPVEATGSTTEEYLRSLAEELQAAQGIDSLILQHGEVMYQTAAE